MFRLTRIIWILAVTAWCLLVGLISAKAQQITFTTLRNFANVPDGAFPVSGLVQGADGDLYGTTVNGGYYTEGTIYTMTLGYEESVLHSFPYLIQFSNTDGAWPEAPLVQGSDGDFYGTTTYGGANDTGVIFKIAPDGTFTTLHSFSAFTASGFINSEGANPTAPLVEGSDGSFYGMAPDGGPYGVGTVFKITSGGAFTLLHTFSGPDGWIPLGGLTQGSDGAFYGTTSVVPGSGWGTIFKITPEGAFTTLFTFPLDGTLGKNPAASLVLGRDGDFYGTAPYGGSIQVGDGSGTIYKITPAGVFTLLYTFSAAPRWGAQTWINSEGAFPNGSLVQGRDGNFYGEAAGGGANGTGTLFKMTPVGKLTPLHTFSALPTSGGYGVYGINADGAFPMGGLIQASDGAFYGTTKEGGTQGFGAVFRLAVLIPADFNADGQPDLLLQNAATGQLAVWFMNGVTPLNGAYVSLVQNPDWQAVGAGDFNRDGQPDILFQNVKTGRLAVWYMDGTQPFEGAWIFPMQDPAWRCVGVTDFNADTRPDLLFQNQTTGQLAIWLMNPVFGNYLSRALFVYPSQDPHWKAVGTGDFNGDGHPDILFQNTDTGQLAIWYMNTNFAVGGAFVYPKQDPVWQAVAVADYNGDGMPNIVFQNQETGRLAVWFMSNNYAIGGSFLQAAPPAGWHVMGPR